MAFFIPFALGAAAAAAGLHILKNKCFQDGDCSCGCGDECECDSDCECGCNSSTVKKKAVKTAGYALDKIKSGLHTLENNINESTMDKIKSGLQTAESKIAQLREKLKEDEGKAEGKA